LIEYAEGRFEQSEKTLMGSINHSDDRFPVLMNAARAAQQLKAHDRRDDYLSKAYEEEPDADFAVCLTKAELQLAHDQNEQALATLSQLHENNPDHTYVITLLVNTYRHLRDWDNLLKILPTLKKQATMSDESFLDFEVEVCIGQMDDLAKQHDKHALIAFWEEVPAHLTNLHVIVEHYARKLLLIDATEEAEKALRLFLNSNWHESTIMLYSELDIVVDNKQLEMVEAWLKDHQNDAYLLLSLGKMCISRSLWGKARSYLEASIAISPMPVSYLKLARLLEEHMTDIDAAQTAYREGLLLLAGEDIDNRKTDTTEDKTTQAPCLKIVKS
jgi:HemY protein